MRIFKKQATHNCPECGREKKGKLNPDSNMENLCWDCLRKGAVGALPSQLQLRFDEMHELEKDWDSYGADAPNIVSIVNAQRFVQHLKEPPIHIGPSVEGGVGVTVGDYYIEFYNDGDMLGIKMDDTLLLSVKKSEIERIRNE